MSKTKLLLDVVNDMRSLADSIEAVCNAALSVDETNQQDTVVKETVTIPLEKVRAVLAEKSQAGFTAEVREIIKSYGADKLSAVDPVNFEKVIKDAEALGNG